MYRMSVYAMVLALLCNLVALIIYPTQFLAEIADSNRVAWELDFAYGLVSS